MIELQEQLKKVATDHNLEPNNFLRALENAYSLKLIGRDYDPPVILKSEVTNKKERRERITKEVNARLGEYIAIFSKDHKGNFGLIPGSLGTRKLVIKNLIKWLDDNEEYTFNDVLKAAEYYVSLCKKDNYQYLVNSHRFVYAKSGESKLSGLIAESLKEPLNKIYTTI